MAADRPTHLSLPGSAAGVSELLVSIAMHPHGQRGGEAHGPRKKSGGRHPQVFHDAVKTFEQPDDDSYTRRSGTDPEAPYGPV
jgi:hypothetical protein